MEILGGFTLWVILAIVAGIVASNKGRSGVGWFFICFFFTPLFLLILLALPKIGQVEQINDKDWICPRCGVINESVRVSCLNCSKARPLPEDRVAPPKPGMKYCPFCAEEIKTEALKCRFCGEVLGEKKSGETAI